MKLTYYFLLSTLALVGCATKPLTTDELTNLAQLDNQARQDKSLYSLSYMIDQVVFNYTSYKVTDTHRFLQVLQKNGQIISVSEVPDEEFPYRPSLAKCTLFPYDPNVDVEACLSQFTDKVIAQHDPLWYQDILSVDEIAKAKDKGALMGAVTMSAIVAPLVAPVAVVAAPMLLADAVVSSNATEDFSLVLGKNDNLHGFLETLEAKEKSISHSYESHQGNHQENHQGNHHGSAYIGRGFPIEFPAVAFGFKGDTVLWIWHEPKGNCGGGFMFWNQRCEVGIHAKAD